MNSKEQSQELQRSQTQTAIDMAKQIELLAGGLNTANREALLRSKDKLADEPTPKVLIRKRPGRAGQSWNYIEIFPMLRELRKRYPIHFFHTIKSELLFSDAVSIVELEIWELDKPARRYIGVGGVEVPLSKDTGKPVSVSDAISASITLAKKKAIAYAGIYPDVYGDDANKFTVVTQDEKDEFFQSVASKLPKETVSELAAVLKPDLTLQLFDRIRHDIDGILENANIERRNEDI